MGISASQVKELRERTGAAMMDCKRALTATDGDMEAAIEKMRKEGQAKADKKAGRVASEGAIALAADSGRAAMVEINSETDFVAKGDDFKAFQKAIGDAALAAGDVDLDAFLASDIDGKSVDELRRDLIAKVGENVTIRRVTQVASSGSVAWYLHGERIGSIVSLEGGDDTLARDIAMHVAASNPQYIDVDQIPAETQEEEKAIFVAQAAESGKPPEIIEKMVVGKLRKRLAELTLVGQPFVKDPDQTVEKLLAAAGAKVTEFRRYEVGEGIEKAEENFAEEVAAQAAASK